MVLGPFEFARRVGTVQGEGGRVRADREDQREEHRAQRSELLRPLGH